MRHRTCTTACPLLRVTGSGRRSDAALQKGPEAVRNLIQVAGIIGDGGDSAATPLGLVQEWFVYVLVANAQEN